MSIVLLSVGGMLALAGAVLAVAALLFTPFSQTAVWFNLWKALITAGLGVAWVVQRIDTGVCAVRWGEVLQKRGTTPVAAQLVRHMLGDDPDSLFIPDSYQGLRAPRAPAYIVDNEATRHLKRKLAQIEYGTIAVCGPRGAGKTTLLEQSVEAADFGLLAQAPATYTPHDFLLSLSVRLCEKYVRDEGYAVPEFTRLSNVRRLLRRARLSVKRLLRWGAFAVPAAALLVLGLSAPVHSLYAQYANTVTDFVRAQAELTHDRAIEIWQGHAVAASVVITIAGIFWWKARHTAWLPNFFERVWTVGIPVLGFIMVCASGWSFSFDQRLNDQIAHLPTALSTNTIAEFVILFIFWMICRRARKTSLDMRLGRWRFSRDAIFGPLTAACKIMLLLLLARTPQTHAILADADNPLRLTGVVTGFLLMGVGTWRPRLAEPELVTQCRHHLYRLQTTQTSTNALAAGPIEALSLGTTHTTSLSTVPPNYPELVEDFRSLLKRIAARNAAQGKVVVIAIDEVDRLGSDTQALAFLSEIKAILGVPYVHYLISVAEDVGAAFVRRGLPHRDVTDSSLDDIIHVQPSTLVESRTILVKRSETLTAPYAMLAHALSGGILRDLLRYGLQIKEMQDKARSFELTDISRHLILEELSETFAGFRTLLSKLQWTPDTSDILSAFRILSGYLRDACPCAEATMEHALEQFAFYAAGDQLATIAHDELANDAGQLIHEASAYAYFSLTLLDIFSIDGLERRIQQAAECGLDGDPERLAEARQELGISPHSARPLIDSIRKAWSLAPGPATSSRVPPPRSGNCPVHSVVRG
ncbi:P-loop NTPase fold protein [Streptomyces sp. NPDC048595]|uniref:P-loop NTPase fold protein n=1 Tax=Streptomyces sp. NPDC048595 TaxID=3365576 RepID=UPI0037171208